MARLIFLLLFVAAVGASVFALRACSQGTSGEDTVFSDKQAEKIAILSDGSVMFAPNGTVARELTDWLEEPDGATREFELGGTQFIGRSTEPTAFTKRRLPRLVQMLKAYPKVRASLIGHAGATRDPEDDERVSEARAEWGMHWLTSAGISSRRISAAGVGSAHSLFAKGSAQAGRNERVTLRFDVDS